MDFHPWDYVLAGVGCALVTTLGIFIGLSAQAIGVPHFAGPIIWEELPGQPFHPPRASCRGDWKNDGETLFCNELLSPPAFAKYRPTSLRIHKDPASHTIASLHFMTRHYSPTIITSRHHSSRMLTWPEAVANTFELADCLSEYTPYPQGALWHCDNLSIAHTAISAAEQGSPTVHLWLGDPQSFLASFRQQAERELRQRALISLQSADELLATPASPQAASADRELVTAYVNLLMLPEQARTAEDRAKLTQLPNARQHIRNLARAQRQFLQSPAPFPAQMGLLHIPVLRHRTPLEMETLLGEGFCHRARHHLRCTYGDNHWQAQVLFIDDLSQDVIFNFRHQAPPFGPALLPLLGLPASPPALQEHRHLRWESLPGIERLDLRAPSSSLDDDRLELHITFSSAD